MPNVSPVPGDGLFLSMYAARTYTAPIVPPIPIRPPTVPGKKGLTMSTRNDFYVRATNPKTAAALVAQYPWARTQRGSSFFVVEQTDDQECPKKDMAALSAHLKTDVIWLMYQSVSDSFQFHHWCNGKQLRSLVYGCYEEQYTWEEVKGVPEPWERKILFSPKRLKSELDCEEDETRKQEISRAFRDSALHSDQTIPGINARLCAWQIASHYRLPGWPRKIGFPLEVPPNVDRRIRAGLSDQAVTQRLLKFFRREFEAEESTGFARLSRVPDSHVMSSLALYRSLNARDRASFRDCCAHAAHANYGFIVSAPEIDHSDHPFFMKWITAYNYDVSFQRRGVLRVNATIQQYERNARRGVENTVPAKEYRFAKSVHLATMPDLRMRVPKALETAGLYKIDKTGAFCCRNGNHECLVYVNFRKQLQYSVIPIEFRNTFPPKSICFEQVLGFGHGDWDCILEENVGDAMSLLGELVRYCAELPARIRAEFT
jgi:hypothetical protein